MTTPRASTVSKFRLSNSGTSRLINRTKLFPVKGTSSSSQAVNGDSLIAKLNAARLCGRLTDVTFTFAMGCSEKTYAHRIVLAMSSPVFEAMFYGGCKWKDTNASETVEVSDIHHSIFEMLVEFLYSGKLLTRISVNKSIELLYAASKYCVDDLMRHLIALLAECMTLENVLVIFEAAVFFEMDELKSKCWVCIECDTDRVFLTDKFVQLERHVLREIIQHEPLSVSEIELYKAVLRWAVAQVRVQEPDPVGNDAPNPEKLRNIIGEEIFHLIRFPTMDARVFSDGPVLSGMLSQTEINNILLSKFSTKRLAAPLFTVTPRSRHETHLDCPCTSQAVHHCSFCSNSATLEKPTSKEVNMFLSPKCYCRCRMRKYCPCRKIP